MCGEPRQVFPGHVHHVNVGIAIDPSLECHPLPVGGRDEPVDGRAAARIDLVGIDDDAGTIRLALRVQDHQERLLRRWLALDGEQRSGAPVERRVGHGLSSQDLGDTATDVVRGEQWVEHAARVRVLLVAPLPHVGIVPVLEPTIVVDDLHAVVGVRDGGPP